MGKVHLRCFTWYNGQFVLGCQISWKLLVTHGKRGMLSAYIATRVCIQINLQCSNMFILGLNIDIMNFFWWNIYLDCRWRHLLEPWFCQFRKSQFTWVTRNQKSRLCTSEFWILWIVWNEEDLYIVIPVSNMWGSDCFIAIVWLPNVQCQLFKKIQTDKYHT